MRQIPVEYLVKESDILEKEGIYVHTPSPFAREHLFYVTLDALYTCGPQYEVKRTGLEAFLLFYIHRGELFFFFFLKTITARDCDVVLLDCRRAHHYRALTKL